MATVSGWLKLLGVEDVKEGNSLYLRDASSLLFYKPIYFSEPVPCGSSIRLKHANTKGYLHSHQHKSPLSGQQEVSCYDGKDNGDNWKVQCVNSSDKSWIRENPVQLIHEDTNAYLSSYNHHQFGHPIPGQLEVAGYKSASKNSQWMAQVI